ncbi:MAG: NifU family protein [Anaerolineae bacterium]|nr:NifU family protein [Anaerolineae bacterium]
MLTFTQPAQDKITEMLNAKGQDSYAVRIRVAGRDVDSFVYDFRSVESSTRREDDLVVDLGSFQAFVDPESAPLLDGASIDFGGLGGGGFKIDNPNPVWTDDTSREVAEVIANRINPAVASHGGRITLVDVKDNVAYIRMQGGCQGCGMAAVTLHAGIEKEIRKAIPAITSVIDVTRHEEGNSPYYAQGEAGQSAVKGD